MNSALLLLLLADPGAPVAPSAGAAPGGSIVATVWDMTVRGGWIMIPLVACSLVAMTIVVERLILTRKGRVVPRVLLETLMTMRHNPRGALAACAADSSPLSGVVIAAVKARDLPRAQQESAVAEAGEREMRKLRQRMRLLSSLPQVATMLGLLGTVLGMIRTFTVVAASADSLGKTERLAQGIHEAWTATAGGLIVAIPTLLAFHIIMARIDAAASALDEAANLWLTGEGPSAVAAAATSASSAPLATNKASEDEVGIAPVLAAASA